MPGVPIELLWSLSLDLLKDDKSQKKKRSKKEKKSRSRKREEIERMLWRPYVPWTFP